MRRIVRNEKLVTSEACLLEALIRWYKHSERNREEVFQELFQFIKLENIDSKYLRNMIKKENLKKVLPREMVCMQGEKTKKALLSRRRKLEKGEMVAKFSNVFVITSHIDFRFHDLGERRETNFKIRYWQPFVGWTSDLIKYNLTGPPEEPLLSSRLCECRGYLYSSVQLHFWRGQGQFLSSPVVIDSKLYVLHHAFWFDFCHYPTALDGYVNDRSSAFDCYNWVSDEQLPAHLFCFDLSDHSFSIRAKLGNCRSSILLRVGCYLYAIRQGRNGYVLIDRYDTRSPYSRWESLTQSNSIYHRVSIVPYGLQTVFAAGSENCGERYDVFTDTWSSTATELACLPQEWTPGFVFLVDKYQPFRDYSQVFWSYSQVWLRYLPGKGRWKMRRAAQDGSDSTLLSLADHNFSVDVAGRNDVKEPFSPHGRDLVTSSNPPF